MRILTLSSCPLDPMLGSGKTRLRWSEGLRALGHEVDVFEPQAFEWWHGARRGLRFRQALGAAGFVRRQLALRKYDLVEFFGGEFGLATAQLAREPQRPFTVAHTDGFELLASEREREYDPLPPTLAGRMRGWYRAKTHDRLSRAAFASADAFVTGCDLDLRSVIALGLFEPAEAVVVAPGLDDEYLACVPRQPKGSGQRIAFTGSWIARKGTANLVRVMHEVLGRRPQVQLDLYGTGGGSAVIAAFSPAVRDRVSVHGRLSNLAIAEGLSRAGVFFFPSQYEGFGMALAEAMACGCAPVTTPTGFGAELRNGEEAFVCGFNDTAAMVSALLALIDNEGLRSTMAERARRRVDGLSWPAQVKLLEAAYLGWLRHV